MSIKDIKEAQNKDNLLIGIKQCLKNKKKVKSVFIAKDTRDDTVSTLEKANIEFIVLKPKSELSKELNLDFYSEVFSIL